MDAAEERGIDEAGAVKRFAEWLRHYEDGNIHNADETVVVYLRLCELRAAVRLLAKATGKGGRDA